MTNLQGRVLRYLRNQGIPDPPEGAFRLQDDGFGPYISLWKDSVLGQAPTEAQLAAITEEVGLAEQMRLAQKVRMAPRELRALGLATYRLRKLTNTQAQALTVPQWLAMIDAAWDDAGE